MIRFVVSLAIGLIVGLGIGVYVGWVQFPVTFVNSPAPDLAQRYKDEYTVMIASGYRADNDLQGVIERLRVLGVENVAQYVQDSAERYITTSQDIADIQALVNLAVAFDRLTPMMEPYRQISITEPGQ